MTRENAKALLPVIQAFTEGKTVQIKASYDPKAQWQDCLDNDLYFGDAHVSWRIKPEPREFWIGIPILDKTPDQRRLDARVEDAAVWSEPVTSVRYEIIHVREVLE